MTYKKILIKYSHLSEDQLPEHIRARLETDPALRQAYNNQRQIQKLVSLKRHEYPDDAALGRIQYKVKTRLEAGERLRDPIPQFGWSPAFAYGAATVVLGLLAINFFFNTPPSGTPDLSNNSGVLPSNISYEVPIVRNLQDTGSQPAHGARTVPVTYITASNVPPARTTQP